MGVCIHTFTLPGFLHFLWILLQHGNHCLEKHRTRNSARLVSRRTGCSISACWMRSAAPMALRFFYSSKKILHAHGSWNPCLRNLRSFRSLVVPTSGLGVSYGSRGKTTRLLSRPCVCFLSWFKS